jgi:hypothetical protein
LDLQFLHDVAEKLGLPYHFKMYLVADKCVIILQDCSILGKGVQMFFAQIDGCIERSVVSYLKAGFMNNAFWLTNLLKR